MGRKFGLRPLFGGGELGPHLAQYGWTEAHLYAKCHLDPFSRWPQ